MRHTTTPAAPRNRYIAAYVAGEWFVRELATGHLFQPAPDPNAPAPWAMYSAVTKYVYAHNPDPDGGRHAR